jgi:CxxC motif-containing protein (DUF1111 family)
VKKIFLVLSISLTFLSCSKLVPGVPDASDTIAEPTEGLSLNQLSMFLEGDKLFAQVRTVEEGLGPIYIQSSCEGCHVGDGKGHPVNMVTRYGKLDNNIFSFMLNEGGPQIQTRAIPGFTPEELPNDATHSSDRVAPIVIGLGFLQSVHDSVLLNLADPFDADMDGISGRVNYVQPTPYFIQETVHVDSSGYFIGRFGKKSKEVTIRDQVIFALIQDLGLTTEFEMTDPIVYSISNNATDNVPDPEVGTDQVERLTFYMKTLKAPTRRDEDNADVIAGDALFNSVGCVKCHVQTLTTGESDIKALSNKEFHPFTDLLIHNMGPALDDGLPEGNAHGNEWRTAPLWGLGLAEDSQGGTGFYLHDGRATSLRQAIGFHGGEATGVVSNYSALSGTEQDQLIKFLKSL